MNRGSQRLAFALVALMGLLILLGGPASAQPRWWGPLLLHPIPPCDSVVGDPCQTSGGTGGTATGGTATAGSTTTTATASTSTTGATATTSTASTAGTSATSASAGATGTSPDPQPLPNPDPTTGTTSTTGATGATTGGTDGGSTGGAGGWDPSKSGPKLDDGTADNGYVSGTNVNVTFTFSIRRNGDSPYTGVTVRSADVKIGNASDSQLPNQPINQPLTADANGDFEYPLHVRFASTHFLDATTLPLDATFYYRLTGAGAPSDQDCALATFHVKVYNKGLAISTTQEYDPGVGQYVAGDPSNGNGYSYVSRTGALAAVGNFKGIGHGVPANPGNPPVTALGRSTILAAFKTTTDFFGFTHGELDGFLASYVEAAANDYGGDKLRFAGGATSEVGVATLGGRTVPKPNLVLLHACSTLQASLTDASDAFGVTVGGQPLADRAYAGFKGTLWSLGANQAGTMGQHAGEVYRRLIGGWTVKEAVASANQVYQPMDNYYQRLPMIVKGDPYARLVNAYTGKESASSDTWYIVNP